MSNEFVNIYRSFDKVVISINNKPEVYLPRLAAQHCLVNLSSAIEELLKEEERVHELTLEKDKKEIREGIKSSIGYSRGE